MGGDPSMKHFYQDVESGFWYRNAYERLVQGLAPDQHATWVEVGVFHGAALAWLGVEVLNRCLPVTIHAVDTFEGWDGTLRGAELRASFDRTVAPIQEAMRGRFHVHALPSVKAARQFVDGSLDIVWIDADHSYRAVREDIAAWRPKMREGGFIGGDDWRFEGVQRAVLDAFPDGGLVIGAGEREGQPWPWWLASC